MNKKLNKLNCKYPERLSCNYTNTSKRCKFMKYKMDGIGFSGLLGYWYCNILEGR